MAQQQRQRGSSIQRVELKDRVVWRFRVDVDPVIDEKGIAHRRQRTVTCKSEEEAIEQQARLRVGVRDQLYIEPSRITVDQWLDQWLEMRSDDWRPSTRRSYANSLKAAREAIGSKRMQEVRRADIAALKRKASAHVVRHDADGQPVTRTGRTVALMLTVLGMAFKDAVAEKIIATNVVAFEKRPKATAPVMSTWTGEQIGQFLDAVADDPLVGVWHLATLGLRRGEVLGLQWEDIDFEAGVFSIRRARVQTGAEVVVSPPKTERGRRTLPLFPELVEALKATRKLTVTDQKVVPLRPRSGAHSGRYVAVDADGSPLRPSRLNEMFEHYVKTTGLPRIRLHDLRHSAISYLLEQGVPVPTVAAFAGHDPSMTLRVYSHASDAGMKAAAEHFSALRRTR